MKDAARINERTGLMPRSAFLLAATLLSASLGCGASTPPPSAASAKETTKPVALNHPPAVLTPEAIAAGITGPVSVRCILLQDGMLYQCNLVEPMPLMEQRILGVLFYWRYQPALENGVPVAVDVIVNVPLVPLEPGATPAANVVLPFGPDMARPTLISGQQAPLYGKEAREHKIEGTIIVRCIITIEGTLASCRIVKPLPFMNRSVLDTLATQRYTPVTFNGRPVSVDYMFTFHFKLQ